MTKCHPWDSYWRRNSYKCVLICIYIYICICLFVLIVSVMKGFSCLIKMNIKSQSKDGFSLTKEGWIFLQWETLKWDHKLLVCVEMGSWRHSLQEYQTWIELWVFSLTWCVLKLMNILYIKMNWWDLIKFINVSVLNDIFHWEFFIYSWGFIALRWTFICQCYISFPSSFNFYMYVKLRELDYLLACTLFIILYSLSLWFVTNSASPMYDIMDA